MEKYDEAETTLEELVLFDKNNGANASALPGVIYLGATKIAKGEMSLGMEMILGAKQQAIKFQRNNIHVISEFVLGLVQITQGKGPKNFFALVKNIKFIFKNIPLAFKKGEEHFLHTIEIGKKYGMDGFVALAHFHLGIMYNKKKRMKRPKSIYTRQLTCLKYLLPKDI